jgi:alkylation response protein AidB-like acyl-CoA dehydrogenase
MGMNVPSRYGGSEVGVVAYSLAITEIAKACASHAVITAVTNMVAEVIHEFASEALKEEHLPRLCRGDYPAGAFALTEPHAGSDAGAIRTTAEPEGDHYVLNGTKTLITSGGQAGVVIVYALTDRTARKGKGISAFVIRQGTPGFLVGKAENKMGQRASPTYELTFDDCRISRSCILGQEGDGFRIAMRELDGGRIGIASLAVGVGLAALDHAAQYAKEREAFGQKLSRFQAIQWMVADGYTALEAAHLLTLRAAFLKEKGQRSTREASMAKLFATETAKKVVAQSADMLGGYGYRVGYPLERYLRDIVGTALYEGTSEIQRIVISREILGR